MNEDVGGTPAETPKTDFVTTEAQTPAKPQDTPPEAVKPKEVEDEAEASSEEHGPDEAKKPKKGGWMRKISRLEADNATLKAQNAEILSRFSGQQQANPPATQEAPEPKPEQFPNWDEYTSALVDHRLAKALPKVIQEQETKAKSDQSEANFRADFQTKLQRFEAQKEQAREAHEDFDDVIEAYNGPRSQFMDMAIIESEKSGEILYHLASHPEEAAKLAGMDMIGANRYIAKLEAKLETHAPAKVVKAATTQAPPPVTPVKAGAVSDSIDFDNCSYEQFKAWDKRQR